LKPPLFGGQLTSEHFYLKEDAIMSLKRILVILGMDFPDLKFSPMIPDSISLMLHFMSERDTFFCIYSMVQESVKDHRYFTFSPTDCNVFILTFKDVLKKVVPRLYQHMKKKINLDIKLLCEEWFSHLFLHDLPFRTVLRTFDTFLNEGARVLYRIALGLLSAKEASLLTAKDADTFVNIIKQSASQLYNDDAFLKSCFKISLHPDKVSKYKSKNKVKSRLEDSHYPHHIYYRPKVSTPSSIISEDLFEIIYEWIPMRYRITDPVLLYTSTTEGFSLKRFLKKMEDHEPTLLFLKSAEGHAFGAYISSKWRVTGKFSFTGTRETFLFQLMPRMKKWGWTEGAMESFLSVEPTSISIGGGGSGVGLYIDEDWMGSSGECDTFKNDPLNEDKSDRFECVCVEVWGFQ
jgi:TBC1 domain family member 24